MTDNNCCKKTVAVIPCYNEQKTIGSIVTEALKYVDTVIVIDDGSVDKTKDEAKQYGAMVIKHRSNLGKGRAIKTAFEYLSDLDCKAVVFLDGDGQHDPAEIPQVLAPVLHETADMVIGSRFIEGSLKIPFYRRVGQTVLNYATSAGSRVWVTDSQSGFRSFSNLAVNKMKLKEKGFAVESEMQFIAAKQGLKIQEVPITTLYSKKAKRNPFAHGFGVLLRIVSLILTEIRVNPYVG